jgi:hypothetical protein
MTTKIRDIQTLLITTAAEAAKQAVALTQKLDHTQCAQCQNEVPVLADALLACAANARTAVALILRLKQHSAQVAMGAEDTTWQN